MRAITRITVQVRKNRATMFLEYNDSVGDYSFSDYESVEKAIESLPKGDSYFPVRAKSYKLLDFSGEVKTEKIIEF